MRRRCAVQARRAPTRTIDGRLDALAAVRSLRQGAVLDLPVAFEHDDDTIRGRFVATPLPPAEAVEARKRLVREQGKDVTPESLEAAGYVMLFTTVHRERMTASKCLLAYLSFRDVLRGKAAVCLRQDC